MLLFNLSAVDDFSKLLVHLDSTITVLCNAPQNDEFSLEEGTFPYHKLTILYIIQLAEKTLNPCDLHPCDRASKRCVPMGNYNHTCECHDGSLKQSCLQPGLRICLD